MSHDSWEHSYTAGQHAAPDTTPHSAPELAGFIAGLDELPASALDVGCGTGGDVVYLAGLGIAATGIDISPTAVERARDRAGESNVDATFVEGDALALPFKDASFDLVTDHGHLHHVARADQPTYAQEVARVLRPGGRLLVREHNMPGHHSHATTEDDLRAMIVEAPLTLSGVVTFPRVTGHGTGQSTLSVLTRT